MAKLVVIGIHQQQGVDVVALAFRLGMHRLGLLDGGEAGCEVGLGNGVVRIVEQGQGDTPVGHGTGRVGLEDLFEDLFRREVPERVLIAHGPVKAALRHVIA
ncbi:MAG: hypothetical protein WAO08_37960 [Hyphomicrobiaceae bacterium]